jgi:zinc-ribbon domain
MIIRSMAITRCPYCHAIIDENDKYCNNCGTQLLFPEDEDVDEEIPGEKIIEADVEEKDYTVDEPEAEKKPTDIIDLAEDLDEELEEEKEELALDKLVEEGAGADDVTEEVILVDAIEAAEAAAKAEPGEAKIDDGTAEVAKADKGEDEKGTEEDEEDDEEQPEEEKEAEEPEEKETKVYEEVPPLRTETPTGETDEPPAAAASQEEPEVEYITEDEERTRAETAAAAVPRPVTFDTRELEGMGKTIELSKDKVDRLLEVLAETRPGSRPAEEKAEPAAPPLGIREPTGTLPPWASVMKGAPVFAEESGRPASGEEETEPTASPPTGEDEVEIFPRRRASSSTIGLPERVGQSPLPFERAEAAAEEEGEEEGVGAAGEEPEAEAEENAPPPASTLRERESPRPAREPERRPFEAEATLEEAEPRLPFSFAVFLKSKAFDVLFVGLFWLVALWLAAHSLDMTLFEILGAMSGPMFLLYIVFLFMYFFLFKFFLGETLGDRLFRERG